MKRQKLLMADPAVTWRNEQDAFSATEGNFLMGRIELTNIMAVVHCSQCGDREEAKYKPVDMD